MAPAYIRRGDATIRSRQLSACATAVLPLACSPASGHLVELEFGSNSGAENAEETLFP